MNSFFILSAHSAKYMQIWAQRKKLVDFAGSRDAPRSFFAVETSKVSRKHLNLSENKNTSVAYSAINGQGDFNLSRGNKILPIVASRR